MQGSWHHLALRWHRTGGFARRSRRCRSRGRAGLSANDHHAARRHVSAHEAYQDWSKTGRWRTRATDSDVWCRRRVLRRPASRTATTTGVHSRAEERHPRLDEGARSRSPMFDRVERTVMAELLLDVRPRGLTIDPELAIATWRPRLLGAVGRVLPKTRDFGGAVGSTRRPCSTLPKGHATQAKAMLHDRGPRWCGPRREARPNAVPT